jgi:hypothetical protein
MIKIDVGTMFRKEGIMKMKKMVAKKATKKAVAKKPMKAKKIAKK